MRVVIDTNVIIAAFRNQNSAAAKIVDMCISGELQPVGSFKTKQEAARLVQRAALGRDAWLKVDRLLYRTIETAPDTRFNISTDKSDNLYFEASHAGGAQFIITNDHHILEHDGYWGIRAMRPSDFMKEMNRMKG